MKVSTIAAAAAVALALGVAPASAAVVSVLGTSNPWDPSVAGNGAYGVGGATGPVAVLVNAGDSLTIDYLSGLTDAFGTGFPIADAEGYVGGVFGCGTGLTGQGSATPLPCSYVDPTNSGPPIWLNALLGSFVNSSGLVLGTSFATGNNPYNVVAPTGAVALLLGVNDDIFGDNGGALRVQVTGSTFGAAPEPSAWALMIGGFGLAGAALRRRRAAVA